MSNPENLKYTEQHEWIKMEGGTATVGITDHAQDALGDITFVELPAPGDELSRDAEACSIESAKAASPICAPVGGKIAEINEKLEDSPELVNSDPYGEGWIFKIHVSDSTEIESLMDAEMYENFLASQD